MNERTNYRVKVPTHNMHFFPLPSPSYMQGILKLFPNAFSHPKIG